MPIDLKALHSELGFITQEYLDDAPDLYCQGQERHVWEETGGTVIHCPPGEYEATLEAFLTRDPAATKGSSDNLMVLVGPVGSGKSTAVRRALAAAFAKVRPCSLSTRDGCAAEPRLLDLDFGDWIDQPPSGGADDDAPRFWNYVATRLEGEIGEAITADQEVGPFWHWCRTQRKLLEHSPLIHQFVASAEREVEALATGSNLAGFTRDELIRHLYRRREELFRSLQPFDLAWYRIFSLAYILDQAARTCRCDFILLDNVDHLPPQVQRLAVDHSLLLADILKARTIIAIRPLTWQRSVHGCVLINTEAHFSPSPAAVLESRINAFILKRGATLGEGVEDALRSLTRLLVGKSRDRLLAQLLDTTTGLSVRSALRNFHNMIESPLLREVPDGPDPFSRMKVSDLTKAYFFGGRGRMLTHAFANLYSVDGEMRLEDRLCKARILDLLCRREKGRMPISRLFDLMAKFGHSSERVQLAVNELLVPIPPLLWSEDGITCRDPRSPGRIMATLTGWKYSQDLFGEYFYDEVCVARDIHHPVSTREMYEFHVSLCDRDLDEITHCQREHGGLVYYSLYSDEFPALSVRHAQTFVKGLKKRMKEGRDWFDVDPMRFEWVASKVRDIVGRAKITRQGDGAAT